MTSSHTPVARFVLATGDARPVLRVWETGWFACPWCETPNPPQARHCDNPACYASAYATVDSNRASQDRADAAQQERQRRQGHADAQAATAERSRIARDAAWAQAVAEAERRGACLACLRRSRWESAPRFIRHRSPDYHTST